MPGWRTATVSFAHTALQREINHGAAITGGKRVAFNDMRRPIVAAGSVAINTERNATAALRNLVIGFFDWFGQFAWFCARVARAAVSPPYEWRELLRQCDAVGSLSLPLVALAGAATGVVMALASPDRLGWFGATDEVAHL